MITVYLSNRNIRVVDGRVDGGKLTLKGLYLTEDTHESILNGSIVDVDAARELLESLWQTNRLPRTGVRLVLDSNQFNVKMLDVPAQSTQKVMQYIHREFTEVDRIEDPICSYFTMPGEGRKRMLRVFATVSSRAYLQGYLDLFKSIGIRLESIECSQAAALRLLSATQSAVTGTYIVQIVEDIMLTNVLISDGRQIYFNRTRLFADPRTTEFVQEVAGSAARLISFSRTQNLQQSVSRVLVAGIDDVDLPFYGETVQQSDSELVVEPLTLTDEGRAEPPKNQTLNHFVFPVGGLYLPAGKTSLLAQLRLLNKTEANPGRTKLLRVVIPLAVATVFALVLVVLLMIRNAGLRNQLAELQAYNTDPEIRASCDAFDVLEGEINTLRRIQRGAEQMTEAVLAYPVVSSQINDTLALCADDLVTAFVSGYNAETGVLSFEAVSDSMEKVHQFIDRLEQQPVFYDVRYEGYTQTNDHSWKCKVICTLTGRMEDNHEADS